jgi:Flp pilus assembly protein TadG
MTTNRPPRDRDAGSVMPMVAIFIVFLMVGGWALVSASQQWAARRDAHAAAAAAARAAAQADPTALRLGGILDEPRAVGRATDVLAATGYTGSIAIDGDRVTVTVTAVVAYAFPSPGFPTQVTGTATAVARRGVTGTEIGG